MWTNAGRLYVPLCDPLHIGTGWTRSTEETASKKSFQGRICLVRLCYDRIKRIVLIEIPIHR